ncbi:MAG: M48 family metalloprotease [Gammaproteobacteria bacterium]
MNSRLFKVGVLLALLGAAIPAFPQTTHLPDIGGVANAPSLEDERRMGQAVMRNLRRAGALVDDLLATTYINNLGYQLLSAHRQTEHEYHFFLVNDKAINAFALPGGYIGVNYGLVLASQSEDELAAVMAHEIAHVTQKHHSRAYAHQSNSQIPIIAAIIAAALIGDAQVSQAAIASSMAFQMEQQLSFTRANEHEADRIGINVLAEAGFNPRGMADFFQRLDEQSRLYGPQAPEFLRTHPVNVNRITDALNRAEQLQSKPRVNGSQYELMRSRLQVLSAERPADILKTFTQKKADNQTPDAATTYGYLLAQLANQEYQAAHQTATQLKQQGKPTLVIELAALQAMVKVKPDRALKQYEELLQFYPSHPAVIHDYTETLLTLGQANQARKVLNHYLKNRPEQPVFFRLLAKTESLLDNSAASHQAMAEYYYQVGQIHQAIQQLELALKTNTLDFYRLNQIEARQQEFKEELVLMTDLQNR